MIRACSGTLLSGGAYVLTAGHRHRIHELPDRLRPPRTTSHWPRGAAATFTNPHWTGAAFSRHRHRPHQAGLGGDRHPGLQPAPSSAIGTGRADDGLRNHGPRQQRPSRRAGMTGIWPLGREQLRRDDAELPRRGQRGGMPDLGTWSNAYGEEYVADYDSRRNRHNTLGRIPGLTSSTGGTPGRSSPGGDSGWRLRLDRHRMAGDQGPFLGLAVLWRPDQPDLRPQQPRNWGAT